MKCLAAVRRIRRNWDSPVLQEDGCSRRAKPSSVSRVYESQSAFLMLRYEVRGAMGGLEESDPSRCRRMGRWSELRVVRVVHSRSVAIAGVEMDKSGEEGLPEEGSRVGESELSRTRSEEVKESRMSRPRAAARESLVCEYHAGLWALKSPKMRVSSWGVRSPSREGVKLGGQDEVGGCIC